MTDGGLRAGRLLDHREQRVGAARGAARLRADVEALAEQVGVAGDVGVDLLLLEGSGVLGVIDLLEVRDARIFLRGFAGLDEVRDRDGGEQADDRDHDHDFNQGERATA